MKKVLIIFLGLWQFTNNVNAQEIMRIQNGAIVSLQNGAVLTIAGGITLENGSTLNNKGTITLKRNSSSGISDWTDNSAGSYAYGSGTVVLNSSSTQSISSKNIFQRIDINNGGTDLASDISSNKFYLINGIVSTHDFHAIAPSSSQLAVEADPTNLNFVHSWFNGNLRRYITTTSVDSYTFPVGNITQVNLAVLDNLQTAPLNNLNYLDVSFAPKPGNDVGLLVSENGTPYSAIDDGGVWHIAPDIEPSAGKYDVQLYLNGFADLEDNKFAILKRPDVSSDAAEWIVPAGSSLPGAGNPGRIVSAGYAQRNRISDFSQFGIGITITPLPVTLLDFAAHRINHLLVTLHWETSMEAMNKGFAIERSLSTDPSFTQVGFVPSAAPDGNSNAQLFYNFTDTNQDAGNSFYRLRQVDLDNRFVYSPISAVPGNGSASVTVKLFPNPTAAQFIIRVSGTDKIFNAFITDELGRVVRTLTISGNLDMPVDGLGAGSYIVRILSLFGKDHSYSGKVVVAK